MGRCTLSVFRSSISFLTAWFRAHSGSLPYGRRSDQSRARQQAVVIWRTFPDGHGTRHWWCFAPRLSDDLRLMVSASALRFCFWAVAVLVPAAAYAQFSDGPGKAEMVKVCSGCHEIERSAAMYQDRDAWRATFDKMIALGAKGTDQEMAAALDYLAKNFPAEEVPRLNVNKATAIEFESRLSLRRSEAAAVIEYREKHGPFKTLDDLKKIPGVDGAKFEAKKDRLAF